MLPKDAKRPYIIQAAVATIIAVIFTKLGSALVLDPRPFTAGAKALIQHSAENGFPSDHTTLGLLAGGMTLMRQRMLGTATCVLALVVGFCRVAAGVHHSLDIFGSILVAILSVFLAYFISSKFTQGQSKPVSIS